MSNKRPHVAEDDDDEDDYMSDKILTAAAQAAAPQLLNPRQRAPPPPAPPTITKKKARDVVEIEQREQGLSTAISSDNKGFQLLKKMGYKEGSKLGLNPSNGISEPIPITLHLSRSGLGEQNEKKEKIRVREEVKSKFNQQIRSIYQDNLKQKYYNKRLRIDIAKCQTICERLDREKFNLEENSLWKNSKQDTVPDDHDDDNEEQDSQNQWTMEEQLNQLTEYLRNKHFYCLWCGQTFDTFEELESTCPGNERDLH